jgi:hypothetical protein
VNALHLRVRLDHLHLVGLELVLVLCEHLLGEVAVGSRLAGAAGNLLLRDLDRRAGRSALCLQEAVNAVANLHELRNKCGRGHLCV